MAQDYLTLEEVCEALGKSADEVTALVADGRLSEIRDGGNAFFKKVEVDQIAAKEGSSIVDLALTEEADTEETESFASALSSLADDSSSLGILSTTPGSEQVSEASVAAAGAAPEEAPAEGPGEGYAETPAEAPADVPADMPAEPAAEAPIEIDIPELDPTQAALPPVEEATAAVPEPADTGADEPTELTVEDIPEELPAAPAEEAEPADLAAELDLTTPAEIPGEAADQAAAEGIPDLGLSGSSIIGLEAAQEEPAAKDKSAAKEDTRVTKVGISVFDEDELEVESDPMGETQISTGVEELDTVGSGSGLLDLTRESDDTSLGAELLDVISPSDDATETEAEGEVLEVAEADETVEDSGPDEMTVVEEEEEPAGPVVVAASRASAAAMHGAVPLNICAVIGLVGLAIAGLATAGQIQGVWPEPLSHIASDVVHYAVFGGLALIALGTGIFSILADRGK